MSAAKFFHILFFALLAFSYSSSTSQVIKPAQNKYIFKHFGEEEGGFLQNTVMSILPDKNGFLWIATEGGISKFNGRRFIPVKTSSRLHNANFTRPTAIYNKGNDTLLVYSNTSRKVALIVKNKIVAIEVQKAESHGLLFHNVPYPISAPGYIKGPIGSQLESVGMGDWNFEIYKYIGGIYKNDSFAVVLNNGIGIYDSKGLVGKINIDHVNPLRVIVSSHQIIYIDKDNYVNYYSPLGALQKRKLFPISSRHPLAFYNNNFGNYFYCVADTSLYRIDINAAGDFGIQQLITNLQNSANISAVYEKDSNTVVIGTMGNGLYVYKKIYFSMTQLLSSQIQSDYFFTQQLLPDNETIFTGKGELYKNDIYTGKTVTGIHREMYSSLKDRKGDYWYVADCYVLRTRQPGAKADTMLYVPGVYCFLLLEDHEGRIWIASSKGLGYMLNSRFTEVKIKGVPLDVVTRMRQDSTGKYYIGTHHGLYTWSNIHEPAAKEIPEFKDFDIMFVWLESNGMLWVSTHGNGIFLIDKDHITSFPENNGRLAYVHTFVEDQRGYLWMPTLNGLLVTSKKSLLAYAKNKKSIPFFYEFSIKNGLRTNEFVGGGEPSFLRLANNEISFVTLKGLVRFSSSDLNPEFSDSLIFIDGIMLDSAEIDADDLFDVSSKIKNIGFSILSSFWGAEKNEVEYLVTERGALVEDAQWLPVEDPGKINLFSPSNGYYELMLRKRKGINADEYIYKTVNFHVLPKWYRTNIFFASVAIAIILLMLGIFSLRKNYYRRINKVLTQKINEATIELRQMNETLENKVDERTLEIQQAEKKFRDLVEKSLVGVYVIKDGKLPYVNPRFAEIFGYTQEEITLAKTLDFIVYEPDRKMVAENVQKRLGGDVDWIQYEMRGQKKDGSIIYTEVFGKITEFQGGPAIIGTLIDISSKKIAEQEREFAINALQKSEANLNTIFLNTDTVYILLDTNLKIIAYNQRAADYVEKELRGTLEIHKSFTDFMAESRRQEFLSNAKNVMKGNQVGYEKSYLQPNGKSNWYHVRKFPVLHSDKNLLGMMIVISDITENKLLEQEILDQKVQEQKKVTKAILSGEEKERNKIGQELHDNINQILAGTKLFLGTIEHNKSESDHIIKQSMQFLDDAIEEIRNLSKYKVTPAKKDSLTELLQTLVDRFYIATKIHINYTYEGSMDLIDEDLKLNIYRIAQEQINNIIKHAEAKKICIKVNVTEKNIHLLLSDDGKGFDLQSRKTGIGLANMTNRVELFNGTINMESSPGNGCKIEINMPV